MLKNSSFLLFCLFLSIACGGGGGGGSTPVATSSKEFNLSFYREKAGDIFIYEREYLYPSTMITELETETYQSVNEIPAKYSYSGKVTAPYIERSEKVGSEVRGYLYLSSDGEQDIIEDSTKVYTSLDHTQLSGSLETDIIAAGQTFSATQSSTLFSTNTGSNVGSRNLSAQFTVIGEESVSLVSGSVQAIRIDYVMALRESNSIEGSNNSDFSGKMWVDSKRGIIVKNQVFAKAVIDDSGVPQDIRVTTKLSSYSAPSLSKVQRVKSGKPFNALINKVFKQKFFK